jgi:hypothetical protein
MSDPEIDLPPPQRPFWATLVIKVYALLAATLLSGPLVFGVILNAGGEILAVCGIATLLFVCGATLFLIPAPKGRRERGVSRRTIWVPIVGSSILAALVGLGFTAAFFEFVSADGSDVVPGVNTGALIALAVFVVWLGWLVLFGGIALSRGPESIGNRLWQALLVGSVAELLVAVPMHLVVRQRTQCCAGLMTGFGIALGALVLFIALGPAVFVLCYRRYQQVYSRHSDDGDE